jgi:hypothetical protein
MNPSGKPTQKGMVSGENQSGRVVLLDLEDLLEWNLLKLLTVELLVIRVRKIDVVLREGSNMSHQMTLVNPRGLIRHIVTILIFVTFTLGNDLLIVPLTTKVLVHWFSGEERDEKPVSFPIKNNPRVSRSILLDLWNVEVIETSKIDRVVGVGCFHGGTSYG